MKGIAIRPQGKPAAKSFPIVAIGASAGGLEAISELLKNLPEDTGMAYIYIQHLAVDHESMLTDILGRITKMQVQEAKEKMPVKPNQLYIIPPNREMSILKGTLTLSPRPARPQHHLPINQFFISLADQYREKAIGILLSGNPPDGTLGLKAIKAAGGITFAQNNSARFEGMPRNAIVEDAVDLVLSPARMAEELVKFSRQQEKYQEAIDELSEEAIHDRDENLITIIRQIHRVTGVDFSQYKINTIKRRIMRRMILVKIESLEDYANYLKNHANETHQLYQDLLINVTTFFRDSATFEYLKKNLFPQILKLKTSSEAIRMWVPACSTGQEAYSLAMVLMEVLGERAASTTIQIFATDLSELSINKARLGIYSRDEVAEISPRRLERFFVKIDGSFRIIKGIRDLCVFARHNVLSDPPFSRLDLISCCNLLIYLEPGFQKKLMASFHYSLNAQGYLVLGKSETIGNSANFFSQVDKKLKIYAKKKDASAKAIFELSYRNVEGGKAHGFPLKTASKTKSEDLDLDKAIDQLLLKKYTPACVVVNNDFDIIQFRGSTGLFLEPAPGRASLNLLKMARPGLGLELRNIVAKASRSNMTEEKNWEESMPGNKSRKISLEVIPLKADSQVLEKYFLVIFDEVLLKEASTSTKTGRDKKVKLLETELNSLREDMRTLVEEQEAANEELQSVNEEIVSSNEELQSINEELETSKEELESSNEELITINQELQRRNEQLAEIQEYSEAVFTTIRESLLILDKDFKVKNANTCFYQTFQLTEEETIGKLLYDLANKQWNVPRLRELLEEIVHKNMQMTDFEMVLQIKNIGEKVLVLNARRLIPKIHSEQLILLAIEDITKHSKAEKVLKEREAWFRQTADNAPMMIWVAGPDKKIVFVNKAWLEFRELSLDQALGKSWVEDNMHPEDRERCLDQFNKSFDKKTEFTLQYRLKHHQGTYRQIMSKGRPNYSPDGDFNGFIGSCIELPEKC